MSIDPKLRRYIEQNIIPQYSYFDNGHSIDHVTKVIQNSLSIANDYDVDTNKIYAIAAYHDIGLLQGRKDHEKTSARMLISDLNLQEWFCEDDISLMAEAVQDHRASNDHEPRSIYGKIISEADRDIDYCTILTRTIQYSLKNYPDYDIERHFERTLHHLRDKYGDTGYLKLWLNTDINQRKLKELRNAMTSYEKIRTDFEKIFMESTSQHETGTP